MTDAPGSRQRPDYLYSGGNVLMHPPLSLGHSQMYGFFVKGQRSALQQTVDATLNAAAAGRMRFKVLSPYVLLTFTDVQHANSMDPADRAKGWGQETDIVTWVMVGQFLPGSGRIQHIYFYPCHIWVDDCMALINGRELYGYPKYQCEYSMPKASGDMLCFTLAAKGFEPFSPETELAMHPLLEVGYDQPLVPPTPLQDFEALVRQLVELMASDADALDLGLAGWEQVIQTLLAPQIDQIFLKQFPDGAGVKAVYQAIVTAPAKIDKIHSVRLLGGPFECTLHRFASFPLDQALGWALGRQAAILPFHVSMDFSVTPAVELVDNSVVRPQKVAIIGGGVGAMTAAFYLTDQPGWQNRYELTVYQQGWRIGGKGASGRNAAAGQRIEEHGLHIWFGFYENAFALMQKAYGLLNRPAGAPLATWEEAFKPQHFVTLTEWIQDHWELWPIDTPPKPGVPGSGDERLSLWDVVVTGCEWVKQWLGTLADAEPEPMPVSAATDHPGWLHRLTGVVEQEVAHLAADVRHAAHALHCLASSLDEALHQHDHADHELLHASLQGLRAWLREGWPTPQELRADLRRLYICADLAITALIGMFEDHVFTRGFDVINDIDFRAWLLRHGANAEITVDSAPVRGFYDLVFAFEDGDCQRPNIEAGTMLRGMLLVAFAYQGAIMWKMQAGMGDVVFTPLYQLLRQRGVSFKFFHQVEALLPAEDGSRVVDQIVLRRQADVTRGAGHYEPLVDVKGLACWPSTPQYGQILPEQAVLLQAADINLESYWSDWPEIYEKAFGQPLPRVTLQRGEDFDLVVFGASVASVPVLAPRLVEASPALQATVTHVKAVATQAYQLWLTKDLKELGWHTWAACAAHQAEEPVLSAFTEPFDTWAPMDQLLLREDWPAGHEPKNASYFCSVLPMAGYPPPSDHAFPAKCKAEVRAAASHQLNTQIGALWPNAVTPHGFKWDWLVDLDGGAGEQRFASQYWRANVDPSERYVLSVVGSSAHRLATDGSGFSNLYLTGDWIRTGLNAGCVEAATMAGMQTSRAICGWPQVIRGESGW